MEDKFEGRTKRILLGGHRVTILRRREDAEDGGNPVLTVCGCVDNPQASVDSGWAKVCVDYDTEMDARYAFQLAVDRFEPPLCIAEGCNGSLVIQTTGRIEGDEGAPYTMFKCPLCSQEASRIGAERKLVGIAKERTE